MEMSNSGQRLALSLLFIAVVATVIWIVLAQVLFRFFYAHRTYGWNFNPSFHLTAAGHNIPAAETHSIFTRPAGRLAATE